MAPKVPEPPTARTTTRGSARAAATAASTSGRSGRGAQSKGAVVMPDLLASPRLDQPVELRRANLVPARSRVRDAPDGEQPCAFFLWSPLEERTPPTYPSFYRMRRVSPAGMGRFGRTFLERAIAHGLGDPDPRADMMRATTRCSWSGTRDFCRAAARPFASISTTPAWIPGLAAMHWPTRRIASTMKCQR
jgi:hypothetical protein